VNDRHPQPGDLCAPGPVEHSLCGMAPEAFEVGCAAWPVRFAEPGQAVTCPDCLRFLQYVRRNFRGARYTPDA